LGAGNVGSIINSYEVSKSIDCSSSIREAAKRYGFLVGFECTNGLSEKGPKNYLHKVKQAERVQRHLTTTFSEIPSQAGLIVVNSEVPLDKLSSSIDYLIKLFTNNPCVLEDVFSVLEPRIEELLNQTQNQEIQDYKAPLIRALKKYSGNNELDYRELTNDIRNDQRYKQTFQWLYSHFKGEFLEMYVAELFRHKLQNSSESFLRVGYLDPQTEPLFSIDSDRKKGVNTPRRRDMDVIIACNFNDFERALEKIGKSRSFVLHPNR
jgi:hypothetical protein